MALTVADGFPYYISLTSDIPSERIFDDGVNIKLFESFSEEKSKYRYAEGKWSIKQILGHITDHERIMTYRSLRFSRNDKTLLPGYDQELLVDNAPFDQIPYQQLLDDFKLVRAATISFWKMLTPEQIKRTGIAWKFELNIDEMMRATIGHELHHVKVLHEKYLD